MDDKKALIALGRIAALEHAVSALIATHPAPQALAAMWREVCPLWREDLPQQYPRPDDAPLLKAARMALNRFEQAIQTADAVSGTPRRG